MEVKRIPEGILKARQLDMSVTASASVCLSSAPVNNYRPYFLSTANFCPEAQSGISSRAIVSRSLFYKMAKNTPINPNARDRPAKKARIEAPNSKTRAKQPHPLPLAPTQKTQEPVEPTPSSVKGKEKEVKNTSKTKK